MLYSIKTIKNNIDIFEVLCELGAEPRYEGEDIICRSICHGGDGFNLVFFAENEKFFCRSCCDFVGDIFDLMMKLGEFKSIKECGEWLINRTSIQPAPREQAKPKALKMDECGTLKHRIYDNPLKHYPQPTIKPWIEEGISKAVCDDAGIRYNPLRHEILIPHNDIEGNLIGIKSRTLIERAEKETVYFEDGSFRNPGKYQMWRRDEDEIYSFQVSTTLYGIDKAKSLIAEKGCAIVFESEKSVLQCRSFSNSIPAVSCGGSNFTQFQAKQLYECGAKRIILAFDKDYAEQSDKEYEKLLSKYRKARDSFANDFEMFFIIDRSNLLKPHQSPSDAGKEVFKQLLKQKTQELK